MNIIAGIDIGGTKCAVSFAEYVSGEVKILEKVVMRTLRDDFDGAMAAFIACIRHRLDTRPDWTLEAVGISCGGPLDSRRGLILAPPNLPRWDGVDCLAPLRAAFGVPVAIQNDADACALAEWRWGAGQGYDNMIFLTFGTGMGAGLILNGALYVGGSNLAGEVGHIRLAEKGPNGYDKDGSFEGFCSGGGIARLGRLEAEKALKRGEAPAFCRSPERLGDITAKHIADAMEAGDPLARRIYETVGCYLGRGLSLLIDILNPQVIVIGSIYVRQHAVLEPAMRREIEREALSASVAACRIVPAGLGELVGDYASISVGAALLGQARCAQG